MRYIQSFGGKPSSANYNQKTDQKHKNEEIMEDVEDESKKKQI